MDCRQTGSYPETGSWEVGRQQAKVTWEDDAVTGEGRFSSRNWSVGRKVHVPDTFQLAAILSFLAFLALRKISKLAFSIPLNIPTPPASTNFISCLVCTRGPYHGQAQVVLRATGNAGRSPLHETTQECTPRNSACLFPRLLCLNRTAHTD